MITTYIFDLDGVIVDTAKYHYLAWKDLADQLGIEFNKQDNEKLKGVSRIHSLEIILELGETTLSEEDFNRCLVEKNEDYLSYINKMDKSEILPRVGEAIEFLKKNNKNIVLGSASKNAKTILKKVNLLGVFDAIVDGTDITKGKPDPQTFLLGAEKVGGQPEECVVFEDAAAGIQAANSAGMISIGIGSKRQLHKADAVFSGFEELSDDYLINLNNNNF